MTVNLIKFNVIPIIKAATCPDQLSVGVDDKKAVRFCIKGLSIPKDKRKFEAKGGV